MAETLDIPVECSRCGRTDRPVAICGDGKHYCEMCLLFVPPYKRGDQKVGRNARCPCGSGKKFKYCCMKG